MQPEAPRTRTTDATPTSPIAAFRALVASIEALARDGALLVALELKLAASSVLILALLGIVAVVLGLTAWMLLVWSLVVWLADMGLGRLGASLATALVLALATVPLAIKIRKHGANLGFPATRRQFGSHSDEIERATRVDRAD